MLKEEALTKINTIAVRSSSCCRAGWSVGERIADTGAFSAALGARDQLIGRYPPVLSAVLATQIGKGSEFSASVDRCSNSHGGLARTGISRGRHFAAGVDDDPNLTELLRNSRRPFGILENARPRCRSWTTENEVGNDIEQLSETTPVRAEAVTGILQHLLLLGDVKINGPAGSDILLTDRRPADPSKGGAPLLNRKPSSKHGARPAHCIFDTVLVISSS